MGLKQPSRTRRLPYRPIVRQPQNKVYSINVGPMVRVDPKQLGDALAKMNRAPGGIIRRDPMPMLGAGSDQGPEMVIPLTGRSDR